MKGKILLGCAVAHEGALFLEIVFIKIILFHDDIEITVPEFVIGICDFVRRSYVLLTAPIVGRLRGRATVLIGEKQVEFNLRVVNRICADYLVEVVPLTHHLIVSTHVGSYRLLEESPERFNQLSLTHYYLIRLSTSH